MYQELSKRLPSKSGPAKDRQAEEKGKVETCMMRRRPKVYWGALITTGLIWFSLRIGSLLAFRCADSATDYLLCVAPALVSKHLFFMTFPHSTDCKPQNLWHLLQAFTRVAIRSRKRHAAFTGLGTKPSSCLLAFERRWSLTMGTVTDSDVRFVTSHDIQESALQPQTPGADLPTKARLK